MVVLSSAHRPRRPSKLTPCRERAGSGGWTPLRHTVSTGCTVVYLAAKRDTAHIQVTPCRPLHLGSHRQPARCARCCRQGRTPRLLCRSMIIVHPMHAAAHQVLLAGTGVQQLSHATRWIGNCSCVILQAAGSLQTHRPPALAPPSERQGQHRSAH